ncbi:hypothetical protein C1T31_07175 [Hanstruepera neustonica]|uniref:Secretion system C-terminal sorting domain-containing protein n=1 Tax=Hanstruepera neustonica TaxID=1445657 RepID=A0A2K1DZ59_9FLAO|nr:T9SS type A sorting domain-containing protein [Hanstruepera neustonica]PNQ73294.1 hypothetical protein C1T31_07175 [Hanstruepera neustonica]
MKKIYLLISFLSMISLSYAQSPIVTVDRANVFGTTISGNSPLITSTGLTRGAGINRRSGADLFNSRDWDASSLAEAIINDEYVEWTVTSNENFDIEVTEIDLRVRGNSNGPDFWQILYSADGFATTGTPIGSPTTVPLTATDYNLNGLSINGSDETITFRLYAWGPSVGSGWFRFEDNAAWADFGISLPGLRLVGNITPTTSNSIESNIVRSTTFDEPDNILYLNYNATSGLTTSNAIKVGEFIIQDGGDDLNDSDAVGTILTDIEFTVSNPNSIAALAVFDGTTNLGEGVQSGATFIVSSLSGGSGITANDDAAKSFDLYATFTNTVIDNEQLVFSINSATADGVSGSTFVDLNAGGAQTSTDGDNNRMEVVATSIAFGTQPVNAYLAETMTPFPTVITVDSNDNHDLDASGSITVDSTGDLSGAPINYTIVNGTASLDSLIFNLQESDISLLAISSGSLGFALSDTFNVLGPLICIAVQDFDGSTPEWTYSNDVPFFDNGWSVDGYYGPIDVSNISPLDYPTFSGNILGENDLQDEGGIGTSGFANLIFSEIDISSYENVNLSFDWQVIGYNANPDDAQYELFYDGVSQGVVILHDGNNAETDNQGTVNIVIPSSVATVSLIVSVRNNGETGFSGFDNFKLTTEFTGLIYTNSAWTPYPPSDITGSDNAYVKDGNYILGSDIALNNLIVEDGATVSVAAGQSITLNNNLANSGSVLLNSVSTSYSSLIVENKSLGNVTYSRHVNTNAASGGNDLISAPVTGETFGVFAANNSNIVSNPSNTTEKLFGPFDKTVGLYLTYDTNIPAESAVILDPGVGYRAASTDGLNFDFNGIVNTNNIDVAIVTAGPNNPEWNLIGNPYPSYISLSEFLAVNNAAFAPISSGVYGYDGDASDGWEIWNQAYSDANPGALITPGQGFLVAAATANEIVSFTTNMRSVGTTDDFIPGRVRNPDISHLELSLSNASKTYNTDFYFTENASLGLDPGYDSETFGGSVPEFSIYSHLVDENSGNNMAIQSLSDSDISDVIIPLGINANQGEQINISISQSTLPASAEVYLEDNVQNTSTLLTENDFILTPATDLNGTGRFFLRFSDASLSVDELDYNDTIQVYATTNPKSLYILGYLNSQTSVKIYDMQGRLVMNTSLNTSNNKNEIDLSNLVSGIYTVSLINESVYKTKKIIVR